LARNWTAPDVLSVACLSLLVAIGVATGSDRLPTAGEPLAGMGNSGLLTVGALFVVVAGLTQTGAMPVVDEICKKTNISPSKFFMPMAFAATFGGVCTMIGTSTNLVVAGLVDKAKLPDLPAIEMFDITWVGLPCAAASVVFLPLCSRWLLPDRRPAIRLTDDPRQYTVEMLAQPGGPLVGQTVEQAGSRHLPGLHLAGIDRQGEVLPAVGPQERLQAGDRLIFVGIIESVVDLQKMRGLTSATDQTFKLDAPRMQRSLIEAVVSDRCPLVGKSIRAGRFRSEYNAAVIAVARSGKRITSRIGDIYFVTMVFTELVTNNAAAVLVFPIALAAARSLSVSFMPFAITIMIAASGGFAAPIGYQTNLMVYGPGGYRFSDYVRRGVLLDLVFMVVTVLVTPLVYPFSPV
jgi:di/tricarboxylate transporter